jgi:hypothetical protein
MDFVVLGELGYLPFAQSGGQLLFHLITRLSMCAANRPCPDRLAASYQTRRGRPRKLPTAPCMRCRSGSSLCSIFSKEGETAKEVIFLRFICAEYLSREERVFEPSPQFGHPINATFIGGLACRQCPL